MVWFDQQKRQGNAGESRNTSGGHSPQGGKSSMPPAGAPSSMPPKRTWATFLLVLLVNYFLVRLLFPGPADPVTIPYTAFKYAENTGQMAPIREQAGTFADSIKLWSAA